MEHVTNKKILLVEDDVDIQYLMKQLLESEGYDVNCAANGKEALEKLRDNSYDPNLIILDLLMPIMDGYQFCQEQIKDDRLAQIPLIVMSAERDIRGIKTAIRATDYIKKPLDIDTLLTSVEKISKRPHLKIHN